MFWLLCSIFLSQPFSFDNCVVSIAGEEFDLHSIESQNDSNFYVSLCQNFQLSDFQFEPQETNDNNNDDSSLVAIYCSTANEKQSCLKLLSANSLTFEIEHDQLTEKTLHITGETEIKTTSSNINDFTFKLDIRFPRINPGSPFFRSYQQSGKTILSYKTQTTQNPEIQQPSVPEGFPNTIIKRSEDDNDYILRLDINNLNYYSNVGYQYYGNEDTVLFFQPASYLDCPTGYTCTESQVYSWACTVSTKTCKAIGDARLPPIVSYPYEQRPDEKYLSILQRSGSSSIEFFVKCTEATEMPIKQEVNWLDIQFSTSEEMYARVTGESSFLCPVYEPIPNIEDDSIFCEAHDGYVINTSKMDEQSTNPKTIDYGDQMYTIVGKLTQASACPAKNCFNKEDCRFWLCTKLSSIEASFETCHGFGDSQSQPVFSGFLDEANKEDGFTVQYPGDDGSELTINFRRDTNHETGFDINSIESIEGCESGIDNCKVVMNALTMYTESDRFDFTIPEPISETIPTRYFFTGHILARNTTHQTSFKVNEVINRTVLNFTFLYQKCHKIPLTVQVSLNRVIPPPIENCLYSSLVDKANIWACWTLPNGTNYCHAIGTKYYDLSTEGGPDNLLDEILVKYKGVSNTETYVHMSCADEEEGVKWNNVAEYEQEKIDNQVHHRFHLYLSLPNACPKRIQKSGNMMPTPTPMNIPLDLSLKFTTADNVYLVANLKQIQSVSNFSIKVFDGLKLKDEILYGSLNSLWSCPDSYSCGTHRYANFWHCVESTNLCLPLADFRYGYNITYSNDNHQSTTIISSNKVKLNAMPDYDFDITAVFAGGHDTSMTTEFICDPNVEHDEYDPYVYRSYDPNSYIITIRSQYACQREFEQQTSTRSAALYSHNNFDDVDDQNAKFSSTLLAILIVAAVMVIVFIAFVVYHFIKKKQGKLEVNFISDTETDQYD